jgi:hypothetical protein
MVIIIFIMKCILLGYVKRHRIYDQFYVQRGCDSEHRIKELKLGIQADCLAL